MNILQIVCAEIIYKLLSLRFLAKNFALFAVKKASIKQRDFSYRRNGGDEQKTINI